MDWTIFQSHHTDNEEKPSLEENAQAALVVKITAASAGDVRDVGSIPGSGRSLEEGMATHTSILAWRIPWTEEPGRLHSMGLQRVGHD